MPFVGDLRRPSPPRGLLAPLAIALGALAVMPVADEVLGRHPGFLPAFFPVLVASELTTAVVLFAHYRSTPRPLLLGVALTYACSALIVIPHALVFPGVLTPRGVLPEEPAMALWLWSAWHVIFPLGLLLSGLLPVEERGRVWPLRAAVAFVLGVVGTVTLALVVLQPVLPPVIAGDDYGALSANFPGLLAVVAGLPAVVVAAAVRSRRRAGRVGDWVLLAASASLADTLLTVTAQERWTAGLYAGRVCALAASAVVLVALLRQAVCLTDALARSNRDLRAAREDAERKAVASAAAATEISALLEGMGDAFVALYRDGTVAFLNSHGAVLLGESARAIVGRGLTDVLSDGTGASIDAQLEPLRQGARAVAFELPHPRTTRWLSIRAWTAGDLVSMTVRDVSERHAVEEQLAHQALHDSLTGLANRALLLERLEHVTSRRDDDPARVAAILFIDLDGFKLINDSLGHLAGDVALREVATRLLGLVRPADTVARLGGDEFVLVCEEVADHDAASRVADRVLSAVERPIAIDGHEVWVSASVGIALARPDGRDPAALLADADAAMYDVKARRGDRGARFGAPPRRLVHR